MEELKITVAKNISALRTAAKMTQLELAEKLSYSDKSVSKWERGEAIPDVLVLKQIADMYGVTLDYMVSDHTGDDKRAPVTNATRKKHNRFMIETVSVIGIFALATLIFTILFSAGVSSAWLFFIAALPVSFLVLFIFRCIWGGKISRILYISAFIWSLFLLLHLSILILSGNNVWLLYILGIPAQVIVLLAFNFKKQL